MNKSLIFAALLVAPTVFAGLNDDPRAYDSSSPIPTAMQSLADVARQASPTPQQWDKTFDAIFKLVELDPANANLVQALVEDIILPSLEAAREGKLIKHIAATSAGNFTQIEELSNQIDKIEEGMKLLRQLLKLAMEQLKAKRSQTPTQMIKPLAFNPAKK